MPGLSRSERQLLAELVRRDSTIQVTARTPVARQELGFDKNISSYQRSFIEDPSRRVLVCSGRRAGKSFSIIVKLLKVVLSREGSLCWFIAPSRERAKLILWTALKRINNQYTLHAKFNDSELTATFPTGGVIRLIGIEDVYHSDRLRGHPADLYCIDECASFRNQVLEYLIEEAIAAAMEDFEDSQIILAGTPGNTSLGYFHDADQRNNSMSRWSSHHWTVLSNPYFERWRGKEDWQHLADGWLEAYRVEKGWSKDNPIYLREWLALWCADSSSHYYNYQPSRNTIPHDAILPNLKHVIGLDIGHRIDPTAFVVLGYNEQFSKDCYVVDTVKLEAPTQMHEICDTIKELDDAYNPELLVGDYAGGGSFIFEEVAKRYDIEIQDAKKSKKSATTEFINSELHEGRIKVSARQRELIGELQSIRWDTERKRPDPSYPNDLADAFQYGYSEIYSYLFKPSPPKKTKDELVKQEMEEYWQQWDEQQDTQKQVWGFEI